MTSDDKPEERGASRRQFLGASAAVWSLTRTEEESLYDDVETPETHHDSTARPREQTHTGLGGALVAEGYGKADVGVQSYPRQADTPVALETSVNGVKVAATMETDEAREVARSLLEAADRIDTWREQHWSDSMKAEYGGVADADD